MSQQVPYIVDQFRILVERVNTKVLSKIQENERLITGRSESSIVKISYDHGHILEIIKRLQEKDEHPVLKYEKWPLVALYEDIAITESNVVGCYGNARLHLLILWGTEQNYDADQRYEKSFKPILDLIANALAEEIDNSGWYHLYDVSIIKQKFVRRLFWGKSQMANGMNEFVDAIEIDNLNLDMYYADACP